nr:cytochrome P450 [Tanacetum cinerariifolium]
MIKHFKVLEGERVEASVATCTNTPKIDVTNQKGTVELGIYNKQNPFTQLSGSDKIIAFTTEREESDRKGTQFDPITTYSFNKFIDEAELQEVVMGARNFTRINKKGTKLSKLERFLISIEVLHTWPTNHSTALPRKFSDHCPILMESNSADFGPVTFKFFNSWLNEESINLLVQSSWVDEPGCRPDVNLCSKLKALKAKLKPWSKNVRQKLVRECSSKKAS